MEYQQHSCIESNFYNNNCISVPAIMSHDLCPISMIFNNGADGSGLYFIWGSKT